ncbi:Cell differentiation protein RCD1 -like protein [Capsicum baccatum]|uniref:Cell differentiation protein RCD1-like protein n=1 Tax=Capsicum baccatum TaxID=33114 RepID=A0A2G2X1R4_CAPBA|nr:Cell differentiation protein RCD1 -like protein [Capsicum baccatum]
MRLFEIRGSGFGGNQDEGSEVEMVRSCDEEEHGCLSEEAGDTEVIHALLSPEIIPSCLRSMDIGCELSKTVATLILQKILLDDAGLDYICTREVKFFDVAQALGNMVGELVEQPSSRLMKYIIRCYLRLSDNPRACDALGSCLPDMLRDTTFSSCLREDPVTRMWLQELLQKVDGNLDALQAGGSLHFDRFLSLSGGNAASCHCVALDTEGRCYTWGRNEASQLGHGDKITRDRPTVVSELSKFKIVKAAAGRSHTVVVTDDGQSFAFGWNKHGQLGIGHAKNGKPFCYSRLLFPFSVSYSLAPKSDLGHMDPYFIYITHFEITAGLPQYGQLGHATDNEYNTKDSSVRLAYEVQPRPRPIASFSGETIVKVACGTNHTVAVDKNGYVYTLGHREQKDEFAPRRVEVFTRQNVLPPYAVVSAGSVNSACTAGDHGVLRLLFFRTFFFLPRDRSAKPERARRRKGQTLRPNGNEQRRNEKMRCLGHPHLERRVEGFGPVAFPVPPSSGGACVEGAPPEIGLEALTLPTSRELMAVGHDYYQKAPMKMNISHGGVCIFMLGVLLSCDPAAYVRPVAHASYLFRAGGVNSDSIRVFNPAAEMLS